MAVYRIGTLINADLKIDGFEKGDELHAGPELIIEAFTPEDALDEAWTIGNRQGPDLNGETWPTYLRSASVGDVFVVIDKTGQDKFYSIKSVDFGEVPERDVLDALRLSNKRAREEVLS